MIERKGISVGLGLDLFHRLRIDLSMEQGHGLARRGKLCKQKHTYHLRFWNMATHLQVLMHVTAIWKIIKFCFLKTSVACKVQYHYFNYY